MTQYRKGFLKVIIIGDSGVGKTSLLESYNYKKISKSSKPTIGAEFLKKKIILEDGQEVSL
jgi:Ras-related protein Rab-7A